MTSDLSSKYRNLLLADFAFLAIFSGGILIIGGRVSVPALSVLLFTLVQLLYLSIPKIQNRIVSVSFLMLVVGGLIFGVVMTILLMLDQSEDRLIRPPIIVSVCFTIVLAFVSFHYLRWYRGRLR